MSKALHYAIKNLIFKSVASLPVPLIQPLQLNPYKVAVDFCDSLYFLK